MNIFSQAILPGSEAQRRLVELETRRHFLRRCTTGLGAFWLATHGRTLLGSVSDSTGENRLDLGRPLSPRSPHFAPRVKRVIWLHMAGSPSQLELFEHKPELARLDGQDCPQSLLEG